MAQVLEQVAVRNNEFSYRSVPVLAPVTLLTGFLSLAGLITEFALPIALAGCVTGVMAVRQIKRSPDEFTGGLIAKAGLLLSLLCLLSGSALHAYAYATEVPEGCRRVNFAFDISKKEFVFEEGVGTAFHPDVKALDGQKIFLKGYIYPEEKLEGIRRFILCKDSGDCCFGGQPKLTDMIEVVVPENVPAVRYDQRLVSVAGTFRLRNLNRAGNLSPAYEMEALQVEVARNIY